MNRRSFLTSAAVAAILVSSSAAVPFKPSPARGALHTLTIGPVSLGARRGSWIPSHESGD
jgi:hypothetical protein